jgi:hypothetical protein
MPSNREAAMVIPTFRVGGEPQSVGERRKSEQPEEWGEIAHE